MANSFDIIIVIKAKLKKKLKCTFLLILYTDLKSLYNYLIKLITTKKKRLIVNIMSLR